MNTSRKLLILTMILFFLSIVISSVYSSEEKNFRYLEEEEENEEKESDKKILKEKKKYNCTDENIKKNCIFENMNCSEDNTSCECLENYVDGEEKYCEYKQKKKQLTAFLLELFVGFGAGHFYRHHYLMASLKLVAFVFGIYVICLFPLTAKCVTDCCDSDCLVVLVSILFYLYALGLAFWYIWDLVYFGKNKYKDCSHKDHCIDLIHW